MSLEYCIECDQETGNAGIGDDSLYLEDGRGPYCDCCYYKNRVEELETEIERLRRVEEQHNNLRTAAANLIVYLDLGGDHREMLSKLKAALEEK